MNNRKTRLKYFKSEDGGLSFTEPVFVTLDEPEPDARYILKDVDENKNTEKEPETDAPGDEIGEMKDTSPEEEHGETTLYQVDEESKMKKSPVEENSNDPEAFTNTEVTKTGAEGEFKTKGPIEAFLSVEDELWQSQEKSKLKANISINSDDESKVFIDDDDESKVHIDDDPSNKYHVNDDPLTKIVFEEDAADKYRKEEDKSLLVDESKVDDFFYEDSDEFKRSLMENRNDRYSLRNIDLHENDVAKLPANEEFLEDLDDYLKTVKYTANSRNAENVRAKTRGHIGTHPHSLLRYETDLDPEFNLSRLICFTNPGQLIELKDPVTWIRKQIGGHDGRQNPSMQKEMLKAYSRVRDYVLFKLQNTKMGSSYQDLQRKRDLRQNIEDIEDNLKRNNTWGQLESLVKNEANKVKTAKAQQNPTRANDEANCVPNWFKSDVFDGLLRDNMKVYEDATAAASKQNHKETSGNKKKKRTRSEINRDAVEDSKDESPVEVDVEKAKADNEEGKVALEENVDMPPPFQIKRTRRTKKVPIRFQQADDLKKDPVVPSSSTKAKEKSPSPPVIIKPKDFTSFAAFTQFTLGKFNLENVNSG